MVLHLNQLKITIDWEHMEHQEMLQWYLGSHFHTSMGSKPAKRIWLTNEAQGRTTTSDFPKIMPCISNVFQELFFLSPALVMTWVITKLYETYLITDCQKFHARNRWGYMAQAWDCWWKMAVPGTRSSRKRTILISSHQWKSGPPTISCVNINLIQVCVQNVAWRH